MPESIDGVLRSLDEIISESIRSQSPMGYFPALYRKVTQSVKDKIAENYFDDNLRMEKLDVVFASRYLDAFEAYRTEQKCTLSWELAFDNTSNKRLIVLQHLFLGMNAHINLDLGIAAAEVCPGDAIHELKDDFFRINEVLSGLVNEVQSELGKIWPLLRAIDWIAGRFDEQLADFSMDIARDGAWKVAKELAHLNAEEREVYIQALDKRVFRFGSGIAKPGKVLGALVWLIRLRENKNVSQNIQILE